MNVGKTNLFYSRTNTKSSWKLSGSDLCKQFISKSVNRLVTQALWRALIQRIRVLSSSRDGWDRLDFCPPHMCDMTVFASVNFNWMVARPVVETIFGEGLWPTADIHQQSTIATFARGVIRNIESRNNDCRFIENVTSTGRSSESLLSRLDTTSTECKFSNM